MDALAGQGVEGDGERARERLALARAHLGDLTVVEDHAADQLHVEVAHAHRAPADLAGEREGLGEGVVERKLALLYARAKLRELLAELLVLEQLELRLPLVDALDALRVGLELLRFAQPEGALEDGHSQLA